MTIPKRHLRDQLRAASRWGGASVHVTVAPDNPNMTDDAWWCVDCGTEVSPEEIDEIVARLLTFSGLCNSCERSTRPHGPMRRVPHHSGWRRS